jgi:hypothetical protein
MLKRFFLLLIFVSVLSATSAFGSVVIKEKVNEVTTIKLALGTGRIKNELENKNLRQVLTDVIKIKEGKIGVIISKFLNNTSHWVWIIGERDLPQNVNGITQLTSDTALTLLDYNKFQYATNLSIAHTIIHEMIHAYLTLYFMYDPVNARKDYPEIFNAWITSKDLDFNRIQHDEIERSFMDDLALALADYSEIVGLTSVDKYVYSDLAWGGLDFQNNIQLTAGIKKRIQNRLSAEQLNEPFGTEEPVGF